MTHLVDEKLSVVTDKALKGTPLIADIKNGQAEIICYDLSRNLV